MIEITEKIRKGIAACIDTITLEEANRIAGAQKVGTDTVYRYARQLKNGKRNFRSEHVILAIAELAKQKKQSGLQKKNHMKDLEKQLSGIL